MNADARLFPSWIVALAVLVAAAALALSDWCGIAQHMRALELAAWLKIHSLNDVTLPDTIMARYGEIAFLVVAGAMLIVLLAWRYRLAAVVLTFIAIGCALAASWFLFVRHGMFVDWLNPSLALIVALAAGLGASRIRYAQGRAHTGHVFAGVLPRETIEKLARGPTTFKPDGETRLVTCLACSVRHYSALARSFAEDAKGLAQLIDAALAPLIEDAVAHGATIGRYDGRSFAAYWNAPLDDTSHAMHACETASRMVETLAALNAKRIERTETPEAVEIGIGIATGPAIAALYRLGDRQCYCVTGDATILADHIGAVSAKYGPAIVVSDETRNAAQQAFAFLEIDFVAWGSRGEPVRLYAMQGNAATRANPKFRAVATFHDRIFQAMRAQQWEDTRALIAQCRKLSGASQQIYDLYLARIAWFEANPPAATWDGAFRPILE